MKTKFLILLAIFSGLNLQAQKKPKIKGNREVITKVYRLKPFHSIVIGENLHVQLKPVTDTESLELRADENLHEVLEWNVQNGILYLQTNMEIIRKRAFDITIYVEKDLKYIHLSAYSKIKTDDKIKVESIRIEMENYAAADLNLTIADSLQVNLKNKAELKTDMEAKHALINLTDDATLKGYLATKNLEIQAGKTSDADLSGNAKNLHLILKDKAEFSGKIFKVKKEAHVKLEERANASFEGQSAEIYMSLEGKSHLHLKGTFNKYMLQKFEGESALTREP